MSEHVWLHVTSGRGPVECQLAVAKMTDLLKREAAAAGLTAELIDAVEGEAREALRSSLLSIAGNDALAFANRNAGSMQWICTSPIRTTHKRKNWFLGVEVLAPPEITSNVIDQRDVTFEAMRASGPGGQHVNKTESAVRATHKPSGLVTTAREERSQVMNKKLALARLAALLADGHRDAKADADRDRWQQHDQLQRGKARRTFEGMAFREKR
jgi:peptide chain release factor